MILTTAERPIDRISTKTERQFTIKATGKAFRILSSGLYKDKVLAIVRELSCNAYDAHVSAGIPNVPFDVHLPSNLEPWFSVRDYGPALSPNQIETVFTTYFESTKTETNDQIGGLGLGCKSPLSYVDSFNVVSRYEGIKRTYTVFFDEEDTPSMLEMTAEESDEPTGLEVHLPVRKENIREFKEKAERVYRYFQVPPNVSGNGEYKLLKPAVVFTGPNYNICETVHERKTHAIMGVVSYPVDPYAVEDLSQAGRQMLQCSVDLTFDVGDLDITAGREELSYDRRTKALLKTRVEDILSDITQRVIREFKRCPNEFAARKLYGKIITKFDFIRSGFPNQAVPYRGMLISSNRYDLNIKLEFPLSNFMHYDNSRYSSRYSLHNVSNYGDSDRLNLLANDELRIFVDDVGGRNITSRVKQYREDSPSANIVVIKTDDPAELAAFKARMKGVPIIDLSTLEKFPTSARKPTSVLRLSEHYRKTGNIIRDNWAPAMVDPAAGGVYVKTISGAYADGENKIINFPDMYKKFIGLKLFDANATELYAIPKSLLKDFNGDDGWVNLYDHAREQFRIRMHAENWIESMGKIRDLQAFETEFSEVFSDRGLFRKIVAGLPADHPLSAFVLSMDALNVTQWDTNIGIVAAALDIVEMFKLPKPVDLSGMWKQVGEKYNMLRYLLMTTKWNRNEALMVKHAIDYITAYDRGSNCNPSVE